ncbi:MAG: hypothetical protein J6M31_01605 [Bacteroidales bacterium]|nr:hypothetical protein [Bacteroidales bacterium]
MEIQNNKELYDAPSTLIFEVKMESSLLQASLNATRDGYGNAIEDSWGGE